MKTMKQTYLMIDDDIDLTQLMQQYLQRFEIELVIAHDPEQGLKQLANKEIQLIILDVMLPIMDGFEVCKKIRQDSNIPILMLTARGDLTDKVLGLELGCDDYLAKPFEPRELVARCQSLVRRAQQTDLDKSSSVNIPTSIELDSQALFARLGQNKVALTAMEADALQLLMTHKGEVFSRDDLLNQLKGIDSDVYSRSIDILMSRIRQKLKKLTDQPLIFTLRGKGYRYWDESHD